MVAMTAAYKASLNTQRRSGFHRRDEQLARWRNEDPQTRGEFDVPVVIPPAYEVSEFIRRAVLWLSFVWWLVAFILLLSRGVSRGLCARILLMSGVLYLLCALLSPSYGLSLDGQFSNDALFPALLMLAFSFGTVLLLLRSAPPTDGTLPRTAARSRT